MMVVTYQNLRNVKQELHEWSCPFISKTVARNCPLYMKIQLRWFSRVFISVMRMMIAYDEILSYLSYEDMRLLQIRHFNNFFVIAFFKINIVFVHLKQ